MLQQILQAPIVSAVKAANGVSCVDRKGSNFIIVFLQGAAVLVEQHESQLFSSRTTLAQHLSAALPVGNRNQTAQLFITAAAHTALCDSIHLVIRLADEARMADQQHAYISSVPSFAQALAALQAAAGKARNLLNSSATDLEQDVSKPEALASAEEDEQGRQQLSVGMLGLQWQEQVEEVVKSMLLWAQHVQGHEADESSGTGALQECLCVVSSLQPMLLCVCHAHDQWQCARQCHKTITTSLGEQLCLSVW